MTTYMPGYSNADPNVAMNDPNENYRKTQSQIYSLQETILDSTRRANLTPKSDSRGNSESLSHNDDPNLVTQGNIQISKMDSLPILNYTRDKYKKEPVLIGEMEYVSNKMGQFMKYPKVGLINNKLDNVDLPYPYNFKKQYTPDCFLPPFNRTNINKLVKIKINSNEITNFLSGDSTRLQNREIWGSDIYTDDSDPLVVLKHIGFFNMLDSKNDSNDIPRKRTPANIQNQDNVVGGAFIPFETSLEVTILILDCLEGYVGLNKNGVVARSWLGPAHHDGLSFGIYEIKVTHSMEEVDISAWKTQK
ncbi:Rxt3p [Maudiozyma barnettii]|uniref:Similar to Saccharomyces cerevisiae YDL076C RXT3 Subunit of the RPD3L complex n=1 Tax=Maudiozyma barnettii TaxID=61262 RepID=A0A8H2VKA3_9SACH|nr:Rxt3p [Kazachstania barnettii]CAB4256986.1 similar to Saccharomyces cerevisiae YDL076C RXT3 Subunit of the RPD3L complex [Kazachstania barnettii]